MLYRANADLASLSVQGDNSSFVAHVNAYITRSKTFSKHKFSVMVYTKI